MGATVILSPHPDDAVLSLWHLLAGPGEARVVNVFTDAPEDAEPGFWDELTHADDPAARARERAVEDREALALAGRDAEWLGFVDVQYRDEEQPLEPVVDAVSTAAGNGGLLLAPAALGTHPDHALVRAAGLALRDRGRAVALYADVPHAAPGGWPRWVSHGGEPAAGDEWSQRLAGAGLVLAELEPEVHRLDPADEARKREAVGRYRTQVEVLDERFSLLSSPEILRYEVVWRLPPASRER